MEIKIVTLSKVVVSLFAILNWREVEYWPSVTGQR